MAVIRKRRGVPRLSLLATYCRVKSRVMSACCRAAKAMSAPRRITHV
jgi:hypothetical protein